MYIPRRLQVIGDLIPDGANIADVGADHGLLEQYIALYHSNYKILAIENKEGPLSALQKSVGCLNNIEVSHSDGLNQLTPEYDTVVLAGLGGDTIVDILSSNKRKLKSINQIVVDAHSFIPKVREEIVALGFDIDCEKLVFEKNHYYVIISFKRNTNQKTYSKEQLDYGYNLYLDPLYEDYKKRIIGKLLAIKKHLQKSKKHIDECKAIDEEIRRFENYGQN